MLGIVCLRVQGLYLALITWAFAEVIRNYLRMHYAFTGGDRGLESPLLFGTLQPTPYYYFFLGLTVFCLCLHCRSDAFPHRVLFEIDSR